MVKKVKKKKATNESKKKKGKKIKVKKVQPPSNTIVQFGGLDYYWPYDKIV